MSEFKLPEGLAEEMARVARAVTDEAHPYRVTFAGMVHSQWPDFEHALVACCTEYERRYPSTPMLGFWCVRVGLWRLMVRTNPGVGVDVTPTTYAIRDMRMAS